MHAKDIDEMIQNTVALVSDVLKLDPTLEINIVEASNPQSLADLHGVGAYCPSSDFVQIAFDIHHSSFPKRSIPAARLALLHELHHAAKRYEGIEIDKGTLYETTLYEGLADRFVFELVGEHTTWIEKTIHTDLAEKYMEEFMLEKDLPTSPELYEKWFLGKGERIPNWTGYAIGYRIAENVE